MNKTYSETIKTNLKNIVNTFDREDRFVRDRQIREYKKLKYYWDGFTNIWWSEIAHDWRIDYDANSGAQDEGHYDKPINVFKAYLESIIAALSVSIPAIKCSPDDADNALDIETAKAGDKIAELIYKHNDVALLWLHALYVYCTEGLIFAHNYTHEDESYGTYDNKEYQDEEVEKYVCNNCNEDIPDEVMTEAPPQQDLPPELMNLGIMPEQALPVCPTCNNPLDPNLIKAKFIVTRLVGINKKPKSRQCIEVYGGLFVKTPVYAMKQADWPYLIWSYETHPVNVLAQYPDLKKLFKEKSSNLVTSMSGGIYEPYERWGRTSTQYRGEIPIENTTVRNAWLRKSTFAMIADEGHQKELEKEFPNGVKVILVNDEFAHACNEDLDDHWTATQNPLSDYMQHDPLGKVLTPIQDITNDLMSLVIQTIEHGIPQTFADPAVVNFEAYRQMEATPGMLIPTKQGSGKAVSEGFYEVKTAQLSGEVLPFSEKVQELGQLVSGAMPAIFGGAAPNSSKTAAQYSMSRAQALQRLQTPWKMLTIWWKNIFGKVILAYIEDVVEDEKIVKRTPTGGFVNAFIRKAELEGKIGDIELDAAENLPITWSQKKDVIMQMLQAGNPLVMGALAAPENLTILAEAIGLTDFYIPGEDDRLKQYEEIQLLLASEPIQNPVMNPMTGMQEMQEIPSVDVEPMVDNHAIEAEICRAWLISDAGRLAKVETPAGYKNVLLHMQRHQNIMTALAAQDAANAPQPNDSQPKPAAQKVPPNAGTTN